MSDTNEPTLPPPPPPAPVGPLPGYPAAPAARSTPKFVVGLILTILGGLLTLFGLAGLPVTIVAAGDNVGYAIGRLIGGVLLWVAMLVVGIILLRTSKSKAP